MVYLKSVENVIVGNSNPDSCHVIDYVMFICMIHYVIYACFVSHVTHSCFFCVAYIAILSVVQTVLLLLVITIGYGPRRDLVVRVRSRLKVTARWRKEKRSLSSH